MSIINDALKKLQNQLHHSNPQMDTKNTPSAQPELTAAQLAGFQPAPSNSPQPVSQENTAQPAPNNKESRLVLILGILCLLTGLFVPVVNKQSLIVVLLNKIPKQTKPQEIAKPKNSIQTAITEPEQKQKPINTFIQNLTAPVSKAVSRTQSRLIINGTMSRGEQNLALIDGQIYEEGDLVDGVKLIKITPKGVTVLEDGEERVIKVLGQ